MIKGLVNDADIDVSNIFSNLVYLLEYLARKKAHSIQYVLSHRFIEESMIFCRHTYRYTYVDNLS